METVMRQPDQLRARSVQKSVRKPLSEVPAEARRAGVDALSDLGMTAEEIAAYYGTDRRQVDRLRSQDSALAAN